MSIFSLRARWILPIEGPPIVDGVVSISEGRIQSFGNYHTAEGTLHDLGDVVLLPGLVNAHTHLEFSQFHKPLGKRGMALPDWIRLVIASRQHANRDPAAAVEEGLRQSQKQGVTTIGEIATGDCYHNASDTFPQSLLFQEVIGFSAARVESVLADVEHRLEIGTRFPDSKLSVSNLLGISPHAPYTVHPELLRRLVELACKQNLPVAMHLAESPEELELLDTNSGPFRDILEERSMWDAEAIPVGTKPIDYLKMLAQAPRSLVIHGNYLSTDEIQYLADQRDRMSVVYCPRTHDYFEHSAYPLEAMLAAGVNVALGTDSRASNPDLNLLGEMRFVARRFPNLSPTQILEMGTLAGAQALGLADEVGSLTPGKWANLVAIPCDKDTVESAADLLRGDQAVSHCLIRGELIAHS